MNNKEFLEKLLLNNESYKNKEFEILGSYEGGQKILTKNKYGVCYTGVWDLLKGNSPSIMSAIDKNKYCVAQITENIDETIYDYSKVVYTNQKTKIEIGCKIHGSFFQVPYSHKEGVGCPKCANEARKMPKETIDKNIKENNWLESKNIKVTSYNGCKSKLEIECPEGHIFKTRYDHYVTTRNGCPHCHKLYLYTSNNLDIMEDIKIKLYIFKLKNETEEFYKVGIAKNIKNRIKDIETKSSFKVQVIETEDMFLKEAYEKEQYLINYFKDFKKHVKEEFGGHTECFLENPLELERQLYYYYYETLPNENYLN